MSRGSAPVTLAPHHLQQGHSTLPCSEQAGSCLPLPGIRWPCRTAGLATRPAITPRERALPQLDRPRQWLPLGGRQARHATRGIAVRRHRRGALPPTAVWQHARPSAGPPNARQFAAARLGGTGWGLPCRPRTPAAHRGPDLPPSEEHVSSMEPRPALAKRHRTGARLEANITAVAACLPPGNSEASRVGFRLSNGTYSLVASGAVPEISALSATIVALSLGREARPEGALATLAKDTARGRAGGRSATSGRPSARRTSALRRSKPSARASVRSVRRMLAPCTGRLPADLRSLGTARHGQQADPRRLPRQLLPVLGRTSALARLASDSREPQGITPQ